MSELPPVTIFSSTLDPQAVLDTLRETGAKLKVDDDWTDGTASWSRGLFRGSVSMRIQHDRAYYSDDSFSKQLPGMYGYYLRANPPLPLLQLIQTFRFAVSFVPGSFEPDDPRWLGVQAVAKRLDGVIHAPGGFLDANGRILFLMDGRRDPSAVYPKPAEAHPILCTRGGLYDGTGNPRRQRSAQMLGEHGYAAAIQLPHHDSETIRPVEEIARRLMALHALFAWVAAPQAETERLKPYIERNNLRDALTGSERELVDLEREEALKQVDSVGWRLENMWPLAWALGFAPEPTLKPGMITPEVIQPMIFDFMPGLSTTVDTLVEAATLRPADDILQLEDAFYLAHHAARSAQMGRVTTPRDFHPAADGGVIHERRHALSWMATPGTAWDEVSLST